MVHVNWRPYKAQTMMLAPDFSMTSKKALCKVTKLNAKTHNELFPLTVKYTVRV